MGIDANLIVNDKWNARHIETLLVAGLGRKIKTAKFLADHSFFYIETVDGETASMYIARSNSYGGLDATILSMRSNDHNIALLKQIAKVLGGFLNEQDCDSNWEDFQDPHDGNARFVLDHVILTTANSDSSLSETVAEATGYERNSK